MKAQYSSLQNCPNLYLEERTERKKFFAENKSVPF